MSYCEPSFRYQIYGCLAVSWLQEIAIRVATCIRNNRILLIMFINAQNSSARPEYLNNVAGYFFFY